MSDQKENKVYVVYNESILQSITNDVFTFGCLAFCAWFSAGSRLWTFVCFVMFMMFIMSKSAISSKIKTLRSVDALVKFAEQQKAGDE